MTKYSVSVLAEDVWTSVALFADVIPFSAIRAFAQTLIDEWYYSDNFLQDVKISDLETGEVWLFSNERKDK